MAGLRVWADILTPKQVLFFGPVVKELESRGCEVMVTSREYREVGPLAERVGLRMATVGERGGKSPEEQLVAATERQAEIIPLVKSFAPDVAMSTASAVCARVSFGLRVRHVAVNDSPHSEVAGRLSLPLSYHLLCPWVIPYRAWRPFGLSERQVSKYRALDPAAWLKRRAPRRGPIPRLDGRRATLTIRLPESDAPYLFGSKRTWAVEVLESLVKAFTECNLVALCRYGYQVEEVRTRFADKITVPEEVVDGRALLQLTDAFIGMGGTMSAEAALMGVPSISAFQGSYHVERYLHTAGLLAKVSRTSDLVRKTKTMLSPRFKEGFAKRAEKVLHSMEDPVPKIASCVLKAAEQG